MSKATLKENARIFWGEMLGYEIIVDSAGKEHYKPKAPLLRVHLETALGRSHLPTGAEVAAFFNGTVFAHRKGEIRAKFEALTDHVSGMVDAIDAMLEGAREDVDDKASKQ